MTKTSLQTRPPKDRAIRSLLALGLLAWASLPAMAEGVAQVPNGAERQHLYQQERQDCLSGSSNQSREDCLREAGAALQPGGNTGVTSDAASLQDNAEQRCAALPADERQSCLLRMRGQGSTQGSADAGGIFRELTEPAPTAAPSPAQKPVP